MQLQWKPEKRTPDLADVFTFHSHAFSTQFLFAEVLGSARLPMRFSFSPFQGRVLARFFLARFFEIGFQKRCEGVHCVDLGERFRTHIWLQSSASIQRRTSPVKFARSPCTELLLLLLLLLAQGPRSSGLRAISVT